MTIQDAKGIPLDEFLAYLGFQPLNEVRGELWYCSPFRHEHTPSFKLSRDRRGWKDFGDGGKGGNILDLAYRLLGQRPLTHRLDGPQLAQALTYLQDRLGAAYSPATPSSRPLPPALPQTSAYVLHTAQKLALYGPQGYTHAAAYLLSRGIDPRRVLPFGRDVCFAPTTQPHRKRYGIGLLNLSGGYEVRARQADNTYLKTCIGPKDISFFAATIEGRPPGTLHLFEGAPDFYTYLTIYQPDVGTESYLILNGTGLVGRAIAFLAAKPFRTVALWSQYGQGGEQAEAQLLAELTKSGTSVGSMKHLYAGYEDLNAWHMAQADHFSPVGVSPPKPRLKTTPKLEP